MLKEHLHHKHKIHLLKCTGTYEEAVDFMMQFPNGFLEITILWLNISEKTVIKKKKFESLVALVNFWWRSKLQVF